MIHFACGGPLYLSTRAAATGAVPSSPPTSIGRQPFHQSLRYASERFKPTHSRLRIGSRWPTPPRLRLRDLRNVPAPRVDPESRRSAWTKSASVKGKKCLQSAI